MIRMQNGLIALGLLVVLAVLHLWSLAPPDPRPSHAPAEVFSAERAAADIARIAAEPRVVGSSANREARTYLKARLAELGAEVDESGPSDRISVVSDGQLIFGTTLENVVGRFRASPSSVGAETGALLVMAHHDTISMSRGASDNAMGIAVALEAMRAITQAPLERDIVLLFTDGEEEGLLGAREFFDNHPWADDIALAINIDSRGNAGPVRMVQTSEQNASLVSLYARSVASPHANAVIDLFGSSSPNITDLGVPLGLGIPSMNFAALGGIFDYHSTTDTPANLSPASVQDMGEQLLGVLSEASSAKDLGVAGRASFFDVFGLFLVHYPAGLDWLTLAIGWVLLIAGGFWSIRRSEMAWKELLVAMPVQILVLIFACLAAFGIATAMGANQDMTDPFTGREYLINWHWAVIPTVLVVLAMCVLPMAIFPSMRRAWWTSGLILVGLAGSVLQVASPGSAYFLAIPFTAGAAALSYASRMGAPSGQPSLPIMLIAAFIAGLVLVPVIAAYHTLIGLVFAPVTAVFIVMLIWTLQPAGNTSSSRQIWLPASLGAAAAILAVTLVLTTNHSQRHPSATDILFIQNEGQGYWASRYPEPDDWSRQLLGDDPRALDFSVKPYGPKTDLYGVEASTVLEAPVEVSYQEQAPGPGPSSDTIIALSIVSRAEGFRVWFKLDGLPNETRAQLNGNALDIALKDNALFLDYQAVPLSGLNFTLRMPTADEDPVLRLDMTSAIPGLPVSSAHAIPDLPADKMPIADRFDSWATIWKAEFELAEAREGTGGP
ncbi:M20/M25/M40 family metallo-hydrolase [Erythrobacter rubeus]|uniref:M20/M25/M40 family metallo-hydrolase n=1 Tax=Erythrobacter rubeus TaxID=2760803 RepID=A0ABR8KPF2_9SPHN|nr:M20/M25/M40 family metallo-hydrolase [Erythrobacter rubeus]MBD2842603.1 M20/M25/M40 family metallo-hydrolase [Erythrobacter rubeus]